MMTTDSKSSPISNCISTVEAGALIEAMIPEIIRHWEERAKLNIPAARAQTKRALDDSLPEFLVEVGSYLKDSAQALEKDILSKQVIKTAKIHAAERSTLPGYTLAQIIHEYHLLREVIFVLLTPKGRLEEDARSLINTLLDRAVRISTERFLEIKKEEEKSANAQLSEVKTRLSRAIETSKIGFYDWDIEHDRIDFSDQMQIDWGLSGGTTLGRAIESIHIDDRPRVLALIKETVEKHLDYRTEYRIIRSDKSVRWIEARGTILAGPDGQARRFVGTSVDITDRVLARQTLEDNEVELVAAKTRPRLRAPPRVLFSQT